MSVVTEQRQRHLVNDSTVSKKVLFRPHWLSRLRCV